jgi:lipopolysaccharide export system protein LptC
VTQRLTSLFPIALLLVVAAVTVWLDRQVQPPERAGDGKMRHDPDYVVDNFSATRVGPDGKPRYTLSARRMVHYPDDDSTYLDEPKFVNLANPTSTVTVTSKSALVSSDGENAYLNDNVRVVRSAFGKKSEMTMLTSYLHIIPESDIAKTDKPVKLYDANTLITSVGLEFNNETHILKLLSNVRGTYETPKPAR